MRKANIGNPPVNPQFETPVIRHLLGAVAELARASHEQIPEETADAYTLSNITETRTLDCSTATAADVANVLATFLQDMKRRGVKRG